MFEVLHFLHNCRLFAIHSYFPGSCSLLSARLKWQAEMLHLDSVTLSYCFEHFGFCMFCCCHQQIFVWQKKLRAKCDQGYKTAEGTNNPTIYLDLCNLDTGFGCAGVSGTISYLLPPQSTGWEGAENGPILPYSLAKVTEPVWEVVTSCWCSHPHFLPTLRSKQGRSYNWQVPQCLLEILLGWCRPWQGCA